MRMVIDHLTDLENSTNNHNLLNRRIPVIISALLAGGIIEEKSCMGENEGKFISKDESDKNS